MKKFLIIFNIFLFLFLFISSVSEASSSIKAYLFYGEGCPHCEEELVYLEKIKDKYPDLEIKKFEIYYNQENSSLLREVAKVLEVNSGGVPFLVIGHDYFIGYSKTTTPIEIENKINECLYYNCSDLVAKILGTDPPEEPSIVQKIDVIKPEVPEIKIEIEEDQIKEKIINIPILGEIEVKNFSLPLLTIILAFLDGFNPCAMWVLLFLVSLLFGIKNKKKLWLFGLIFLAASALVYFLFMVAWLNLFIFIGFIFWMRLAIGGVALVSAYFNLKEYIINSSGGCKVAGGEKKRKVFEGLKKIIQEKHLAVAILGLILLAFVVNLVELVCSLGLPTVYIQILALSDLSSLQYYLYLIFYVLVFIIPALVVFSISAATLQLTGISTKYGRAVHLISGIIMFIIGILMIFKPGWLMFG